MAKPKKHKDCDIYISPGKWPLYKTRRILFAVSIFMFVFDAGLVAAFDGSMRNNAVASLIWSVVFAGLQFADRRKAHWGWMYIALLSSVFFLLAAFFAFATECFFMRYIWMGQFVFSCGVVFLLLRKKNG